MNFTPNKFLMGCVIIALGSLSVGLETGVVMAGRADNRGATKLNYLHLVAPGIWGGFISILAGVLGMMADKRTQMPFKVPKYYHPYFFLLTISTMLGFIVSTVTLGISSHISSNVAEDCSSTKIDAQLFLYVDLYCYGIVAAVILIPVSITLMILHGIFCYFCLRTCIIVFGNNFEGRERLQTGSTTPSVPSENGDAVNVVDDEMDHGQHNLSRITDNGDATPEIGRSWESTRSAGSEDVSRITYDAHKHSSVEPIPSTSRG